MNDENKIYDLLEKIYIEVQETRGELKDFKEETNTRFNDVDVKFNSLENGLKEFREETDTRFDNLENKLDDIEAHNANRHVEISGELRKIKAGLSKVEIVTADNWGDIARLKARKRVK